MQDAANLLFFYDALKRHERTSFHGYTSRFLIFIMHQSDDMSDASHSCPYVSCLRAESLTPSLSHCLNLPDRAILAGIVGEHARLAGDVLAQHSTTMDTLLDQWKSWICSIATP